MAEKSFISTTNAVPASSAAMTATATSSIAPICRVSRPFRRVPRFSSSPTATAHAVSSPEPRRRWRQRRRLRLRYADGHRSVRNIAPARDFPATTAGSHPRCRYGAISNALSPASMRASPAGQRARVLVYVLFAMLVSRPGLAGLAVGNGVGTGDEPAVMIILVVLFALAIMLRPHGDCYPPTRYACRLVHPARADSDIRIADHHRLRAHSVAEARSSGQLRTASNLSCRSRQPLSGFRRASTNASASKRRRAFWSCGCAPS